MIKYIILAIILNTVLVIRFFTGQDVSLEIKAPPVVEAGSTVDVEIHLNKAGLTGFARFQQELPGGVTASPVFPADMNFSFEDNRVTLIWLSLPQEEEITIRYRINIHERLKGDLRLEGTFSYVEDNQRKVVMASGMDLAITPASDIDERLIVDVSESGLLLPPAEHVADRSGDITAIRQELIAENDLGFVVNILVHKSEMSNFAKIEERIPEGFTAIQIDSKGGIFSFSDQRARIIWNNLPVERSFIVSYRLLPHGDTGAAPRLNGEFSFMQNNTTTSLQILQGDKNLGAITPTVSPQDTRPALIHSDIRSVSNETVRPVRPVAGSVTQVSNPLEAESGVYYRVQVAAGRKPVDADPHFKRLKITQEVRSEIHEGWIKYSVGSFYEYKSARDYRVDIWKNTPVGDAFVTAYNNGRRITVQEALVIANHQWYR
jgi:hypothetical protein